MLLYIKRDMALIKKAYTMNNERILIIDDEEYICTTCRRILMQDNYMIDVCVSPVDALQKVQSERYNLVLCDIRMPKLNGFEVLKKIKELSPDTGVIIMSGFATIDYVVESMRLGSCDFIAKPFELPELKSKIKFALKSKNSPMPDNTDPYKL